MNKIFLIGNLCSDPVLRSTDKGIAVCSFTLAVNRRKGTVEETDFFKCTTWDKLASNCARYLAKGRKAAVVGAVSVSAYKDKTGECRASIDVNAQEVEFLGKHDPVDDAVMQPTADEKKGFIPVDPGDDLPF